VFEIFGIKAMMLESIEQKCLSYLREVVNPLTPIDVLLRYLQRDPAMSTLTETELLAFLQGHDLFRVVESPWVNALSDSGGEWALTGCNAKPRVMLRMRAPTDLEWRNCLREEVATLVETLQVAQEEAHEAGKKTLARRIASVLERATALLDRLEDSA